MSFIEKLVGQLRVSSLSQHMQHYQWVILRSIFVIFANSNGTYFRWEYEDYFIKKHKTKLNSLQK